MRAVVPMSLLSLVLTAGCGGDKAVGPDAPTTPGGGDGGQNTDPDAGDVPADAAVATCTPRSGTNVRLEPVATGLDEPVLVTFAPGDPRLFVVEKDGRIRIIKNGALVPEPFLNLTGASGPILLGSERGLLGLAFHPEFRSNDRFYVHFSAKTNGDHVIAEYRATHGTDVALASTYREVLRFPDPATNHNGGSIEFGPDGKLYIAIGDGGGGDDPDELAQKDSEWFGKLLRIDVDTRTPPRAYGIPTDNPHQDSAGGAGQPKPEIWHKGLRNPFRFTFDRANGNIYIGDVGQGPNPDNLEEIDVAPNTPGINWGWDTLEATRCHEPPGTCDTTGLLAPVLFKTGTQGWKSIMGGQVYRGTCFPDLVGTYFYGDHYAGDIWAFEYVNGNDQNDREVIPNIGAITSIHEDATGELYVTTINGLVRRIVVPAP